MTTFTHDRDGVSVSADVFTEQSDSTVLIYKTEHSDRTPSTLELSRRLPDNKQTVRRAYLYRRKGIILDAGTATERVAMIHGKLELSIPIGCADADVETIIDDIVGVTATTEFAELRQFGLVQL